MKKTNTTPPFGSSAVAPADALQPLQHPPAGASDSASVRVSNFRGKLATEDLKRYELYVSSQTRSDIKHIAKIEGLSGGVAAEALIKLGIESYHRHPVLPGAAVGVAPAPPSSASNSSAGADRAQGERFPALPDLANLAVTGASPGFNALSIGAREIEGAVRFGSPTASATGAAGSMAPRFRMGPMQPGFLVASAPSVPSAPLSPPAPPKGLGLYSERRDVSNAANARPSPAASVTQNLIAAALRRKPAKE